MSTSESLEKVVRHITQAYKGMLLTDPWPASNYYDFYTHHVPTVALNSIGMTNLIHHDRDTIDWLSYAKLEEVIEIVEEIIVDIQDKSLTWARNSSSGI